MEYTFGLIGSGNMGGAIAHAVSQTTKAGILADHNPSGPRPGRGAGFCPRHQRSGRPKQPIPLSRRKAPFMGACCRHPPCCPPGAFVLVTMAAGLAIEQIRDGRGPYPVIRIMPNTPVAVGQGVVLYHASERSPGAGGGFLQLMEKAGGLYPLEESLMDVGAAVSGCGPAYAYLVLTPWPTEGWPVACPAPMRCALPRKPFWGQPRWY